MIKMMDSLVCWVVVLVFIPNLLNILTHHIVINHPALNDPLEKASGGQPKTRPRYFLLETVEAKGVAGLGKAGGDGSGGSDKNGQQVPPEVYNALTYAGSAFLLTLSIPVILYTLNKLLNVIEDCFGCGPASRRAKRIENSKSLPDKRKKDMLVKDMKNQTSTTGQVSQLLLNEKQKLFHNLSGNPSHSLDINSHVHSPLVNGNHHLQNLLIAAQQTSGQQELLLNPLTVVEHAKGSVSNTTGREAHLPRPPHYPQPAR